LGGEKLGGGGGGGCAASPTASTKMVGGSGGVPLSAHLTRVLKTLRRGDADGGRGRCAGLHGGGDRGERGLPVVRGDEQREIMRLSTRMRGEGSRERSTLYIIITKQTELLRPSSPPSPPPPRPLRPPPRLLEAAKRRAPSEPAELPLPSFCLPSYTHFINWGSAREGRLPTT